MVFKIGDNRTRLDINVWAAFPGHPSSAEAADLKVGGLLGSVHGQNRAASAPDNELGGVEYVEYSELAGALVARCVFVGPEGNRGSSGPNERAIWFGRHAGRNRLSD